MIKILLIPLIVLLSACSSTNNKNIKWTTDDSDFWAIGKTKK